MAVAVGVAVAVMVTALLLAMVVAAATSALLVAALLAAARAVVWKEAMGVPQNHLLTSRSDSNVMMSGSKQKVKAKVKI